MTPCIEEISFVIYNLICKDGERCRLNIVKAEKISTLERNDESPADNFITDWRWKTQKIKVIYAILYRDGGNEISSWSKWVRYYGLKSFNRWLLEQLQSGSAGRVFNEIDCL